VPAGVCSKCGCWYDQAVVRVNGHGTLCRECRHSLGIVRRHSREIGWYWVEPPPLPEEQQPPPRLKRTEKKKDEQLVELMFPTLPTRRRKIKQTLIQPSIAGVCRGCGKKVTWLSLNKRCWDCEVIAAREKEKDVIRSKGFR